VCVREDGWGKDVGSVVNRLSSKIFVLRCEGKFFQV
jgi:hypothetical protein